MVAPIDCNVERIPLPYEDAPRLPAGQAIDSRLLFSRAVPPEHCELEIGPGRGGFLLERLEAEPGVHLLGLEIRLKWASLVDAKVRSEGHGERCRVFAEDIRLALPRLASDLFSRVYVHFPDPWWKKRHAKRRLANGGVMDQVARVLVEGGELFVQTDVWGTARAYRDAIESHPAFEPFGDESGSATLTENPYGARSPRERRSIRDGMPVIRLRYRRKALPGTK